MATVKKPIKKAQNGGKNKEYVKRMNTADSLTSSGRNKFADNLTLSISGLKGYNSLNNPLMQSGSKDIILADKLRNKKPLGPTKFKKNGGTVKAKDGKWIQKAINPKHKGYCTPETKATCTPKRKALAKTLRKISKNK